MTAGKLWQRLFTVPVILVLLSVGLQPQIVNAKGNLTAGSDISLSASPVSAVRQDLSAPLAALPVRMNGPQLATDGVYQDPANGPYKDLATTLPLPKAIASTHLPQADADRPITEPDARVFDDPMPGLDAGWEGLNQGSNRTIFGFGVLPPDTNGDASPDHYIQTVNTLFAVWDLSQSNGFGGFQLIYGPAAINTLFSGFGGACEATNDGDPIVLYDEQADRWLISQFGLPNFPVGPFSQCIAISATSDPLGAYHRYEFQFDKLNDYPHFGIWNDGYYMTINQFMPGTLDWGGQGIVIFERDAMLDGDPADMFYFDPYDFCTGTEIFCFMGGMLPGDAEGTPPDPGTPNFVMQFDDDAWGYSPDQLQLWSVTVDWTGQSATLFHRSDFDLPVNAFDSDLCGYGRSCIPQPGTSVGLDAISDRLMYRLQYRNFGSYETMVVNHTVDVNGADQAGIRWYELRNTGAGWQIYQQSDFAPDSANRWMGSIAMDEVGNIALGYSVSSSSIFPTIRYAGRLVTDPLNSLARTEQALTTLGAGSQTSTASRWGDYSSMSVTLGCEFIYTNEYLRGTTPAEWYTRIGAFSFDSCWFNDTVSPETYLDSFPPNPSNSSAATFTFHGDDFGGQGIDRFDCSLDGSDFAACTSPKTYTGLSGGSHTFQVRAVDTVGNMDQTPASYTWMINLSTASFKSVASKDGDITETNETSGVGGSTSAGSGSFRVGDNGQDRQLLGILSFDTSSLPDTAVVTAVHLRVMHNAIVGTDPTTTHGPLLVDIRNPYFGTSLNLQGADFQAAADVSGAGTFGPLTGGWYTADLTSGLNYVNLTGTTQFRVRFTLDDNDDRGTDLLKLYSGNAGAVKRPVLIVEYYVP